MAINLGTIDKENEEKEYKIVDGLKLKKQSINSIQSMPSYPKVSQTEPKSSNSNNIFQKLGKTAINIPLQMARGTASAIEGIYDTGVSLGLGVAEWIDSLDGKIDKKDNGTKIKEHIADNQVDNVMEKLGWTEELYKQVENDSFVKRDNIGGQVVEGIGGMLPSMLVGGTAPINKALSYGILGTKSFGSGTQEAFTNKSSTGDALKYGLLSAGTEIGSEFLTGGIPGIKGTKGLDDIVAKKLGMNSLEDVSKKLSKEIFKAGYKMVGEAGEEALTEIINPLLKNITYSEGEKINWNDVINSAIVGGITGGILEAPQNISNFRTSRNMAKNSSINSSSSNLLSNQVPNYPISTTTDNNSLNLNEKLTSDINISTEKNNPQTSLNELKTTSITNKYQYELSDNEKINKLNESASIYFDNSQTTKDMLSTMSKIITDKNYNIIFDDGIINPNTNNQINAQIKTLENGETEIRINPKSERAGEFLIMHEVTHAIETADMKKLVVDYASKNNEFNRALENLKTTYGADDVSSEVLADISGQLFGNQEFINTLLIEKPSIFKRIYDSIVSLANRITGNSKESLFIKDLRNKWENAYRIQNNRLIAPRYSTIGLRGAKNLEKNSSNRYYKNLYARKENAKLIHDYSNKDLETTNIKSKRETGWIKTKYGDWGTLISDKNSKIIKKLEANKSYKLGEILEHDLLYKAYPELKKVKVITADIGPTAGISKYKNLPTNEYTTEIYLKNNDLNKKDFRNSLLHEINHYIEMREHYNKNSIGSNTNINNKEDYRNNLGEIISNETKIYSDFTQQELDDIILPEQAKNNPKYENIQEQLKEVNKKDRRSEGENDNVTQTNKNLLQNKFEDNSLVNIKNNSNNRITNYYDDVEMDNSSFKDVYVQHSKQDNGWQDYLESNYKSSGTRTNMQDIKQKVITTTEDKLIERKQQKIEKKYEKEKQDLKKKMSKEAARILEFSDYKTKHKFQEIISEFYDNPDLEGIKQSIKINFGEQIIEYTDEETKKIKSEIRSTKLKVDNDVKRGIIDYETFRRSNFNKLKLTNEGQSIDSFYKELSEIYPNIFKDDLINPVDQLKRLSEFMDEDIKITEKYKLDDSAINDATKYIYDALKSNVRIDDLLDTISISPKEIRKEKTHEYREYAQDFLKNSSDWQDKNMGIKYKTNTMKRNFYDIMSKEDASRMYSSFIQPIFKHNSQMQIDITSYNEKIKMLNLNEKESTAVQMLGEYKYNPETLLTGLQVNEFIEKNKLDYNKIKNSVEVFRDTYDELFERVNQTLKSQGYKELEYRKGYFPHFTEEHAESKFGKMLEKMGWKFQKNEIPTSIAGITDTFKPGKVWTSFSQQRKGKITDYNALQGFDNYIRGAMETIYFTEDIQKLRALENEIRYQHSEKGVQKQIDEIQADNELSFDEKQEKIDKIFATYITPLNNLVSEIRDYTNGIARKKSGLDRTMEQLTNREVYSVMTNVSNRLSANMVGLNFSSAITNFIPITQATSQVEIKYLVRGLKEAIKNQHTDDGFESKSVFLTSRLNEAEKLYKTELEKWSDRANFMFEGIDSITSNAIVRGKYYQNLAKGMSEFNAIRDADEFARDLIAGRTKGEMPTAFNSKNPLIRIFTSFQLEVNNQYGYMFKDVPRDLKEEGLNKLIGAFFKMFVGAWLYNQFTERVVGRKSAFSPVDTITEVFSTATNDNLKTTEKSANILENLTQDIPFVGGLVGGGRLPISSIANPLNIAKGESTFKDEAKKALFYTIAPFGGGQAKKIYEGALMYAHDIPGSYTSSGKLRFETDTKPTTIAQNVLFGQYSTKNARDYFEGNNVPLTEKQLEEVKELGISIAEYRKYRKDYSEVYKIKGDKDSDGNTIKGSATGKKAYSIMNNDKISEKEKDYLLSVVSDSKEPITSKSLEKIANDENVYKYFFKLNSDKRKEFINDLENYGFNSHQLVDFYKTKEDYKDIYVNLKAKELITNYLLESDLTDEQKYYLYSKEYSSEETINLLNHFKVGANNYFNTMNYVNDIKSSYQGDNYTSYRRNRIQQYINGLNATVLEKVILFKQSGYSITKYKSSIYQYIENMALTKEEKQKLWKQLY